MLCIELKEKGRQFEIIVFDQYSVCWMPFKQTLVDNYVPQSITLSGGFCYFKATLLPPNRLGGGNTSILLSNVSSVALHDLQY